MRAVKHLFVCLGNICRSPTAEGVLLHMVSERKNAGARGNDVVVDSAGTADFHVGEAPDPRTIAHAARRGYDLSALRARHVAAADFLLFDRVYAMDQANLRNLRALAPPEHVHKLTLFLDVLVPTGGAVGREVPDPYHHGPALFDEVLDLCEAGCRAILAAYR